MKRIVVVVAALGLVVGACGGGDDDGDSASADIVEATAESQESTGDEASDQLPPEPSDDAGADATDDQADDQAEIDDEAADDDGGDDDGLGSETIRSIDDIPEVCREQMADYLREVEPLVSTIDWQAATLADFEAIAEDFEARSEEFEQRSTVEGCDDLDFIDDNEFDLMVEFAADEAPGTVEFFEFLAAARVSGTDDTTDGSTGSTGFTDCESAIEFVQGLVDDYDSFTEVPASQLLQFADLASVYVTCTPEQLEFFDNPEVTDFLSE